MDKCGPENLHLCGAPPLSFASKEAICEEGSLTVILAILFIGSLFTVKQILYRSVRHEDDSKGIFGIPGANAGGKKLTHLLEETIIKPFIPTTMESFVAFLYFWWFLFTVPMAITRFYEKRWANQALSQQGPFNLLSKALGCNGFDITALPYTESLSELHPAKTRLLPQFLKFLRKKPKIHIPSDHEQDHFKEIDFLFTVHLAVGLGWLTFGFLQIFWVHSGWSTNEKVRMQAHRWFGRLVALPFLFCHILMALSMAVKNPANQIFAVQCMYYADVLDAVTMTVSGIRSAIKAKTEDDKVKRTNYQNLHKVKMGFVYIKTTFGSGAIRLTVWFLWLIGKFFAFENRIRIDRGECQTYSKMLGSEFLGDADQCWEPVFLNLLLTDVLILWLEWLFLCVLKEKDQVANIDENAIKVKFNKIIYMTIFYGIALRFDFANIGIIFYALIVKLKIIHDGVVTVNTRPAPGTGLAAQESSYPRRVLVALHGEFPHEDEDDNHQHQE